MAFVSSSFGSTAVAAKSSLRTAKLSAIRASRPVVAPLSRRVVRPSSSSSSNLSPRMDVSWSGEFPPSEVLGLGKDIPSALYALMSVAAFLLGCYGIYQSNFAQTLSADNVNPQFVLASLLVPISWGLHVAAWIQKENGK